MRAVVQRVSRAEVRIAGGVVGAITGPGLCVLLGVSSDDGVAAAEQMAKRLWNLRILEDDQGRMNLSCSDLGAPLLVISQFTLYADTSRGRRPSFPDAMPGPEAEPLVEAVVDSLRGLGAAVATGRFGADMAVELVNDGPVTIILET